MSVNLIKNVHLDTGRLTGEERLESSVYFINIFVILAEIFFKS